MACCYWPWKVRCEVAKGRLTIVVLGLGAAIGANAHPGAWQRVAVWFTIAVSALSLVLGCVYCRARFRIGGLVLLFGTLLWAVSTGLMFGVGATLDEGTDISTTTDTNRKWNEQVSPNAVSETAPSLLWPRRRGGGRTGSADVVGSATGKAGAFGCGGVGCVMVFRGLLNTSRPQVRVSTLICFLQIVELARDARQKKANDAENPAAGDSENKGPGDAENYAAGNNDAINGPSQSGTGRPLGT
ncbi:hypothetical protein QBC40DRAFT_348066 [Triangularia verruculosa]|uniref:Uncharacterized protein n=1 Tax=Triangularia verruculosa TaxID=2587418 RepID=A0AAN6XIH5_9PEZI|nr:hypothetical protein QBC40DRAFT_348066 [Triangularia verruculosa]